MCVLKTKMTYYLSIGVFAAFLGIVQMGYNFRTINVPHRNVKKFLNETFKERFGIILTQDSISIYYSIAMSVFPIGLMIGGLCSSWIAEKFGRKLGMLIPQVLSILGATFMGCCKYVSSYELLIIGRLFVGISSAILNVIGVLYMVEIVPIHIRGMTGSIGQLAMTLGIFLSNVLGLENVLGGEHCWPLLLGLTVIPSIIQSMILPFLPETPRYLILSKRKIEQAEDSLKKLRDSNNVRSEISRIQLEEQSNQMNKKYSIRYLLVSRELRLILVVCVCMSLSEQACGIAAVLSYSTVIFESAGIDDKASQYATVCMSAILVVMSFLIIPLMERLGRRSLHLTGMGGLIICNIMITVSLAYMSNEYVSYFLIGFVVVFLIFFGLGPASIPRLAPAEIFTQGPRSAALSLCFFVVMCTNFIVSITFPLLHNRLKEFSFLPFAIISSILFLIIFWYFPETKNRASNELSLLFQAPNAWKTRIGHKKMTIEHIIEEEKDNAENKRLTSDSHKSMA